MARLYLDEHLHALVSPLRNYGHDVVFAVDIGGQGKTDAWHFREALASQRTLLTLDRKDFQYFHRLWTTLRIVGVVETEHAGILRAVQTKGFTYSEWLPVLQDKLVMAQELRGRMYTWHPDECKWYEDSWRPEE